MSQSLDVNAAKTGSTIKKELTEDRIPQNIAGVNTSDEIAYNEALDDELTMREVLTGALEGAALTEADEKVLERYRRRVREIDGYDERLREK